MRAPANPSIDKKFFTRTASKVKDVNLGQKIFRGGIRF